MVSPVPALPDAERRTQAVLTASGGPVSVGFALYGDGTDYQNWVQVYLNGVRQDPSIWTLTSPSGALGLVALPITDAVVTFKSAVTGTVQIVGARRPRRLAQFNENQGVSAHDLNVLLTDLAAELREAWDARSRTFQVPPGEFPSVLPPAATRANQNAIFDGNGNMTSGLPIAGSVNVSAAMAALLGLASVALARAQFGTAETIAAAQATAFDASINTVETMAFATAGDEGGGRYKRLAGAPSPITPAHFQSVGGAWWELRPPSGIYRPEQFGAKGDNTTDDAPAINAMFEFVPNGSTCLFGPKYYRVKKQAGKSYGIRLRKGLRIIGSWGGGDAVNAALVYDNSFGIFDNVFLIQTPGLDEGLNLFTLYGLEIAGLFIVPFAASLGFTLTLFSWDPTKEYCLYANDIVHFDIRGASAASGSCQINRLWMHDCYIFTSGGPNGGQGTGVSINVDCAIDASGMITSVFERLHTSGGIRWANVGDSNTGRDWRMDGKGGLEAFSQPGASEQLFDQLNYAGSGPAFYWRWGKFRLFGCNFEAHGRFVPSPDVALIDIRMDLLPFAGLVMNGIIIDGITLGDQTSTTGGAATPLTNLIYINNSSNAVIRRVNMYSSAVTQTGIFIDSTCTGIRLDGPFTRQSLGAIPNLVFDKGTGTYGFDQLQGGPNANAAIAMTAPWTNINMKMRKHSTGFVALGGLVSIATMATGTILTLPFGFRPDSTRGFAIATGSSGTAGLATVEVLANGTVTLLAFNGTPTQLFLDGIVFKEATHDNLVSGT